MNRRRATLILALAAILTLPLLACREHRAEVGAEVDADVALPAEAGTPAAAERTAVLPDEATAKEASPTAASTAPQAVEDPISHEWSRVYRLDERGKTRDALPIGFLHRRFSPDDPDGRTYVVDRLHVERGYLLPDGRTLQFQLEGNTVVGVDDLGNTGFDTGVKRLLGIAGGIEYETTEIGSAR